MDRARFEALLAAYGADVSRWPEGERAEAAVFSASHGVELDAARQEAREIDTDEARREIELAVAAVRKRARADEPPPGRKKRQGTA